MYTRQIRLGLWKTSLFTLLTLSQLSGPILDNLLIVLKLIIISNISHTRPSQPPMHLCHRIKEEFHVLSMYLALLPVRLSLRNCIKETCFPLSSPLLFKFLIHSRLVR
ncbi:hypothetical protein F5890DRAFT_1529266 [Lentinula detonsa]|uniref:Uncharacterized protein n=1 Tax=Lentinula detonsa TaxID=2804962 RepID=A0AA38PWJ9_9AGAR|nr:hypothetical protein F5890DRAFT_1529266 [Lentinula detonsa]